MSVEIFMSMFTQGLLKWTGILSWLKKQSCVSYWCHIMKKKYALHVSVKTIYVFQGRYEANKLTNRSTINFQLWFFLAVTSNRIRWFNKEKFKWIYLSFQIWGFFYIFKCFSFISIQSSSFKEDKYSKRCHDHPSLLKFILAFADT